MRVEQHPHTLCELWLYTLDVLPRRHAPTIAPATDGSARRTEQNPQPQAVYALCLSSDQPRRSLTGKTTNAQLAAEADVRSRARRLASFPEARAWAHGWDGPWK